MNALKTKPQASEQPQCGGCGCGCNAERDKKQQRSLIMRLFIGGTLLAVGLVSEYAFAASKYIQIAILGVAYILLGCEIVINAFKNIIRGFGKLSGKQGSPFSSWFAFDENFLMTIATIGAFMIGEYPEAVGVMLFYQVGEYFQERAVTKSKKSIEELMDIRPDYANLKKGNEIVKVNPDSVQIGDVIIVKSGEKIPLDGVVVEGKAMLETAALTGESTPKKVAVSDSVLSGCINKDGLLAIEVTKTFGESTVQKIIELVKNAASKKAATEKFITKFARFYTPVVVGLATLLAVVPPLFFAGDLTDWISRALIFLVISCPCALVISIPLGFFGGIGAASKKGILVKGGNYLEVLNNLDVVVFDKTGTLTKGVFKVTAMFPADGFSSDDLLKYAAYAEAFSNHPIALSILSEYDKRYGKTGDRDGVSDFEEIAGHGVTVNVNGKKICAGNGNLMSKIGIVVNEASSIASIGTKVFVAADNVYIGCITISDEIRGDSRGIVSALKSRGICKTIMLTGDNPQIAEAVANELGIDEVYGGLLPQNKVEQFERIKSQTVQKSAAVERISRRQSPRRRRSCLAFVGDGINDAPVLAMADVGIAMGGLGSDAAIEAADIVLMTDEPSKLVKAIEIARFTKRIVWQNIIFALGVKTVFMALGALGVASMWEAVFADVGVSLLAVLNAVRVLRK